MSALEAFSALSQSTRLEVFRLLIRCEPLGLPAGEIAARLGVPQNTLSTHLAVLTRAGLTSSERRGRSIVYRVQLDAVRALVGFLTDACCDGRPELCLRPDACGCSGASNEEGASSAVGEDT
ncbi:MAG: metalloregulator ArsR/SmtB family transcription factor [Roseiarcus sp.]